MEILPKGPHKYVFWWAIDAPRRIILIINRVMRIINSRISFSLNVRLLFTPLFGDYSIVGRTVGFIFRIMEIVFGAAVLGTLFVLLALGPIIWFLLPIFLYEHIRFMVFGVALIGYFVWEYFNLDTPGTRVNKVESHSLEDALRPKANGFYKEIVDNFHKGINKMLENGSIKDFLIRNEINTEQLKQKFSEQQNNSTESIINKAHEYAVEHNTRYIEPEHILLGLIATKPKPDVFLSTLGTNLKILEDSTRWIMKEKERKAGMYIWQDNFDMIRTGGFGRGMTGRITPFLNSISFDLTKDAKLNDYSRYAIREKEIKRIAEILINTKENILIIGEPGSGKTSLVKGMAHKIIEGDEYSSLNNKRIVSLELSGIFGGTKSIGDLSDKLNHAIDEAKGSRDIIIFIDEIHNLVSGGNEQTPEVAAIYSILEPHLGSKEIQFIAATNIQNYRKYIEPNGAFARLFNIVDISEATKEETLEILKYEVREIEKKYDLIVTYPAIDKCIELSTKLIHERVLPDKAILILHRTATRIPKGDKFLDTENVATEVSEMTHIPLAAITTDEAEKLLNIEDQLKQMVIGQDHAIKQVASAMKRARVGIRNEDKPISSFLFVGTTGVGKTQTAKALAKNYFGDVKNMVRLDMSEYQKADSINKLIGTPGQNDPGLLTGQIRSKPFTLLLLDEIEKAHPNILTAFLQVLDEGSLTDATGLKIDFTNTIIIATSNVGTRTIQNLFEQEATFEQMRDAAMQDVRSHFSPEFLNRFSGIIVYNPLSVENVRNITRLLLNDVGETARDKNITVTFKDELVNEVIKRGYNPEWGARPLHRVIEETVETFLADKILAKELQQGDEYEMGMEVFE